MNTIINDMYEVRGTNFKGLSEALNYMSNHTSIKVVRLNHLSLYHFIETITKNGEEFLSFSTFVNNQEKNGLLKKTRFSEYTNNFIDEIQENRTMLKILTESGYHLISPIALETLFQKVNVYANEVLEQKSKFRDLWISELLSRQKDTKVTLVCRKYMNIEKVFSVQSNQYKYIDQKILIYLVKQLQKREYELIDWRISNSITEINMQNDEHFGFHIVTSDIGNTSLAIYPAYFTKDSYVILDNSDSIKLLHRKAVNADICEKKDKKKIDTAIQLADKDFTEFKEMIRKAKTESLSIQDNEEIIKKAIEIAKKAGFMKFAGKKNIINFLQNTDLESVQSKFDLIEMIWNMNYSNTDDVSSNLRFHSLKKDIL